MIVTISSRLLYLLVKGVVVVIRLDGACRVVVTGTSVTRLCAASSHQGNTLHHSTPFAINHSCGSDLIN